MIPSLVLLGMVNNFCPLPAAAVVGLAVGHRFIFNLNSPFPLEKQTTVVSPDLYPINTQIRLCQTPRPKIKTVKLKQRIDQLSSRWPKQDSQSSSVHVGVQTATKLQNNTTDVGKTTKLQSHLSLEAPHDGSAKMPLLFC